ncbi:hypothetical protein FACS189462_5000 [Spirochaetia bacterium]|nr:hypothetical protein FACS189462_5000 [Spirochaetia bacterium]
MKENKFFVHRMLAMVLVFGIAVVGCVTQGNTKKGEVETSKTTNYSKLELIGNSFNDGGSEWTTDRQIKLTDCVPNGAAKPGTQYIVTIEGITDKQIDNFCIDWCVFDEWKSIAGQTVRKSVSGSFTYKGLILTKPDVSESDLNHGYFRIINSGNPAVSNRGDIEAILANVRITIEEIVEDTMLLIGNSWTNDNGARSEWTTEKQIKLTDYMPNGAAKPLTQYIVTIEGTTDKTIDNFCIDWGAYDDWKSIAWETSRKSVSGNFTYQGVISTLPDISESDFNRGYLRIKNSGNPAVSNRGNIAATLTNVRITIEELAKNINGVPKTIKITGYRGSITAGNMDIFSEQRGANVFPPAAGTRKAIDGQTITFTVINWTDRRENPEPWTGTGKFFIIIYCSPPKEDATKDGSKYVYSVDGINPAPVDISDEVTVLEWAKFIWLEDFISG